MLLVVLVVHAGDPHAPPQAGSWWDQPPVAMISFLPELYLSIYQSIYLSIDLSIDLSIYRSIHN
jgi:hypothetical protein